MNDIFKKMRDQAALQAKERASRKREADDSRNRKVDLDDEAIHRKVADFTGIDYDEIEFCCGNCCPDCESFLDKAIALVELGFKHHLFLNPVQQEVFDEALALFQTARTDYDAKKQSFIDRLR